MTPRRLSFDWIGWLAAVLSVCLIGCGARTEREDCRKRDCRRVQLAHDAPTEVVDDSRDASAAAPSPSSNTVAPLPTHPPPMSGFPNPLPPSVDNALCTPCAGNDCADLRQDDANWGACGSACVPGTVCGGGRCRCEGALSLCSNACVDVSSDSRHCGGCGVACPVGSQCKAGRCDCGVGEALCGDTCVNVTSDVANCGGCGVVCGAGQECVSGSCRCPARASWCGGECVDLRSDHDNCGACGNNCGDRVCMFEECVDYCPRFATVCGNGDCVSLQHNPAHCGECGTVCGATERCSDGECVCGAGFSECDGGCIDVLNDRDNCGSCGHACAPGERCAGGQCVCPGGGVACDGA